MILITTEQSLDPSRLALITTEQSRHLYFFYDIRRVNSTSTTILELFLERRNSLSSGVYINRTVKQLYLSSNTLMPQDFLEDHISTWT